MSNILYRHGKYRIAIDTAAGGYCYTYWHPGMIGFSPESEAFETDVLALEAARAKIDDVLSAVTKANQFIAEAMSDLKITPEQLEQMSYDAHFTYSQRLSDCY